MAKHSTLTALFTDIADAIREKKESTDPIIADNFPMEIDALRTGFDYVNPDVTEIPDYAFYGCEDLNSVDCYNLTSVGASAFENCTNLKSVILYESVETVGENTFKGCRNVTIYCYFENQPDTWHENWNPDGCKVIWLGGAIKTWDISATTDDSVIAKLYQSIKNENMYSLIINGNGKMKNWYSATKTIWYNYAEKITTIIMMNVTNIGMFAFNGFTNLISIIIPNSVTSIGQSVFSGCKNLTSIIIPNGVTSINYTTFRGCKSLTSITIPNSVTNIDRESFNGCENLTSIIYTGSISQWKSISFGINWSGDTPNYTIHCTDGDIAKDGTITYHTTT